MGKPFIWIASVRIEFETRNDRRGITDCFGIVLTKTGGGNEEAKIASAEVLKKFEHLRLKLKADIQSFRRMGQCPDRYYVNARQGDLADIRQRDAA